MSRLLAGTSVAADNGRSYSVAFKQQVLDYWFRHGKSYRAAGKMFNISFATVMRWVEDHQNPQPVKERAKLDAPVVTVRDDLQERYLAETFATMLQLMPQYVDWPAVRHVRYEYRLPRRENGKKNGRRIDLLIEHIDDSYTIVEAKGSRGLNHMKDVSLLYGAVGQLLYYHVAFTDHVECSRDQVRLCLLCDWTPDAHFVQAIEQVRPTIQFVNPLCYLSTHGEGQ